MRYAKKWESNAEYDMTQDQKELLIKDLCARLPYGVKIELKNSNPYHHENIAKVGDTTIDTLKGFDGNYFRIRHDNPLDWDWYVDEIDVEDIKPYLLPTSSMTEEQKIDLTKFIANGIMGESIVYDWYNKNHFDYRGFIPMGLAKDATGLNIY